MALGNMTTWHFCRVVFALYKETRKDMNEEKKRAELDRAYVRSLCRAQQFTCQRDEAQAKVAEVERERDEARAEIERLRAVAEVLADECERLEDEGARLERNTRTAKAIAVRVQAQRDEARRAQDNLRKELAEANKSLREVKDRARRVCQILIEEIGVAAVRVSDVDTVAERAAVLIRELRDQVSDLQAEAEESEHHP